MRILAVIPARSGSKRFPNKNMAKLEGVSLIQRSFESTKGIGEIQDVLFSSDCEKMIKHAQDLGMLAPWIRPDQLSEDSAKTSDVVIHALDWYQSEFKRVDAVLLLQPTSPFRKKTSIQKAIDIMRKNNCDSVVSVSATHSHPEWCFKLSNNYLKPFIKGDGINKRSQDLVPAYNVNGNLYLTKTEALIKNNSFFSNKTIPYITNSYIESLDIDTMDDFELAKYYINQGLWF